MTAPARPRALARVAGALGLGLLAVASPALAADPGSFAGDPLTPAGNVIEATPIASGLYTVAVPDGEAEQFVEVRRTIAGSTLWYGASTILPKSDRTTSPLLTLESSPDGTGDPCIGFESLSDGLDQSTFSTRLFTTGHRPACQAADSLVLRVAQNDVPPGTYQLVVWEEPPLEDGAQGTATLPDRSVTVPWAAMPSSTPEDLVVGTTYDDAPEVTEGTYAVHVDPGRPALVKVPLTWGQHAQVAATSTTRTSSYATVSARWLTPLGGVLGDIGHSGGPGTTELSLNSPATPAGWTTPTIAWKNREGRADEAPAAITGDYYLSIDTYADEVPSEGVDLTLDVAVVTDYPATAPAYTQAPPAVPYVDGTGDPSATATATGTSEAAGRAGGDSFSWILVGGLFAGSLLFAAAGAVALARRGRTA